MEEKIKKFTPLDFPKDHELLVHKACLDSLRILHDKYGIYIDDEDGKSIYTISKVFLDCIANIVDMANTKEEDKVTKISLDEDTQLTLSSRYNKKENK